MTRLTYVILGCCAIAIAAALQFLLSDPPTSQRVREMEREADSPREPLPHRAQIVAAVPRAPEATPDPAPAASFTLPPGPNAAQLAQQVAELSMTVERLEQTVQNLEERLARSLRPLPTGDRTSAGLAGKKAEVEAQTKRFRDSSAELQRFAARYGMTVDERVVTDSTFPTLLDTQPGFAELRTAATNNLRVLQAVERRFAADLLERASFQ